MVGEFTKEHQARRRRRRKLDTKLVDAIDACTNSIRPVIDLGAGNGEFVLEMRSRGYLAIGVDGSDGCDEASAGCVIQDDLVAPRRLTPENMGVLVGCNLPPIVTCFEVGEHIPAEYEDDFIATIAGVKPSALFISWAVPGQRGRGHVNCHTPEYVANRLGMVGFRLNELAMATVREIAGRGWNKKLLAFHGISE